ncbi:thioredoxin domain-containing protein, partial [Pelagibacterales bacterium SAG-MED39]|nr:thioredoxin domain-containing protein [Pelagibacterales bacterium SAG-MED39]
MLSATTSNAEIVAISEGKLDAKIKMVVYESLTCSHCADFHKEIYPLLKKNFIDNGLVNIEFRNFPLDIAALNASKIAHCNNDGSSKILHYLYENQSKWVIGKTVEELNKNLKRLIENSSYSLNFDSCINDKALEDHILEERIDAIKSFKVQATPTLIILGEKF